MHFSWVHLAKYIVSLPPTPLSDGLIEQDKCSTQLWVSSDRSTLRKAAHTLYQRVPRKIVTSRATGWDTG